MQQCPSCLESFSTSDALIVPHCGQSKHAACQDCTARWYAKQSHEPCMICRVNKHHTSILFPLRWFVLGFAFTIFCVWLNFTTLLLFDVFMLYISILYVYLYHKHCDSMPTRNTWMFFAVGVLTSIVCTAFGFFKLSLNMMIIVMFIIYNSFLFGLVVHISWFLARLLESELLGGETLIIQLVLFIFAIVGYINQLHVAYIFYLQQDLYAGVSELP